MILPIPRRLHGDPAAIATVLLMPLAVPLIVPGLVDPWTVAKPLLMLLFLPDGGRHSGQDGRSLVAVRLLKVVRPVGSAATVLLLVAIGVRYFEGFVEAVGSYAIAAQLIYAVRPGTRHLCAERRHAGEFSAAC